MKRHHHEVVRLVKWAKQASEEELMDDYGIELYEDGSVYDTVEDITFDTLNDWAETVIDSDDDYDVRSNNKINKTEWENDFN